MIIRPEHIRAPGIEYCSRGARKWFALHGLDWNRFVTQGIPEEELLATGDALAIAVVEEAKKWAEKAAPKQ